MTNGPGLHFRQQLRAKFDQSLVEQNARPPSPSHDSKWCNPFTATALNSVQSFEFVKCHFGMWRAVLMLSGNEVLRRTYDKDNRVLRTAKLSQSFKVVPPSRAWQGAGISTGGTKIGVTGSESVWRN
jgi:hypothetical protein